MTDLGAHIEEIRREGFTVVPGVLEPAAVARAVDALDEIFAGEADIAAKRGWSNHTHQVSYLLPAKHREFRSLCSHPGLLAAARAVLGDDCVVASFNGLSMTPGGEAQELHIDQEESVRGDVVTVNAVCVLDDFTEANGATRVVPGSHQRGPVPAEPAAVEPDARAVEAPSGSVILIEGRTWHAGGSNASDRPRRALHVYFAKPWIRPHWDFPGSLPADIADDLSAEERRLLGFCSRPPRFDVEARRTLLPS